MSQELDGRDLQYFLNSVVFGFLKVTTYSTIVRNLNQTSWYLGDGETDFFNTIAEIRSSYITFLLKLLQNSEVYLTLNLASNTLYVPESIEGSKMCSRFTKKLVKKTFTNNSSMPFEVLGKTSESTTSEEIG